MSILGKFEETLSVSTRSCSPCLDRLVVVQ